MKKFFYLLFICYMSCMPIKNKTFLSNNVLGKYKTLTLNSHASEGGFARANKNDIIVIYRKDSSLSHISNHSKIVSKISRDKGETWSKESDVYNSPYDDRNLVVGNLSNGNIIIVFRKYDAVNKMSIGSGYIISSDNGKTWSDFVKLKNTEKISHQPFGNIFTHIGKNSFLIHYSKGITKMYSSIDDFDSYPDEFTIINDSTKILREPFLVKINKKKSLILFRNENGRTGQGSFYQYNSNGESFYYKGETNIFDDYGQSVRSPASLRYNPNTNLLEVCVASRVWNYSEKNFSNELRIYSQDADSVFYNSKAYQLKYTTSRPMPSNHWFYGYPKFITISDNEVLYLITDSKINNTNISPRTHINNEQLAP